MLLLTAARQGNAVHSSRDDEMSYLNDLRIVFSGTFQADTSTVNNDVRHYDNALWEPRFQDFQTRAAMNGWWNPIGSGAFRLIDCRVRGVYYSDGTSTDDPTQDPAVGLLIGGSDSRVSGKIVDLDPQWQVASQLWGLDVTLTRRDGALVLGGRYAPHAFRDLVFGRRVAAGGDAAASAYFQSVLEELVWAPALPPSRVLNELRRSTTAGRLSVRLSTFGFDGNAKSETFTLGQVSGVIGPYLAGEPESFVLGRRFTPQFGPQSWNGINYFTGTLDASGRLLLDFSNALPLAADGIGLYDLGTLSVGVLQLNVPEGGPVNALSYTPIDTIPYRDPGWLLKTGGIFGTTIVSRGLIDAALSSPLALAVTDSAGRTTLAIVESINGLMIEAEPLVLRIDGKGSATTRLYAGQWGAPLAQATVVLQQSGAVQGLGGDGGNSSTTPKAPIPVAGVPETALSVPAQATTGADGTVEVTIATEPPSNPRGYIDGQLYMISYQIQGQSSQAHNQFDQIAVHLRDAYSVPNPTWDDIRPIFVQYGNLYPIMSRKLIDLSNLRDVYHNRKLLTLAFSLPISDPNHMPVTRDLSQGKRAAILAWLREIDEHGIPDLEPAAPRAAPSEEAAGAKIAPRTAPVPVAAVADADGGKTRFARSYARATGKPGAR
jgi:hypothetical protein